MSNNTYTPELQALLNQFQNAQRTDESIFLGLQIAGGHILLPLLLITIIFSHKIKRHPVFINFCVSWILSSVVSSLLLYNGRSSNDLLSLNPSDTMCLVQACLLNGVQALTSGANLALVLHLLIVLLSHVRPKGQWSLTRRYLGIPIYSSLMVMLPFVAVLAFTVVSAVIGNSVAIDGSTGMPIPGSNLSVPGVFTCTILLNGSLFESITPGLGLANSITYFSLALTFITLFLEVISIYIVYKRRDILRKQLQLGWIFLLARLVFFSLYRTMSLALSVAPLEHPDELLLAGISNNSLYNGIINYLQAAIPLVAFLVFATEKDILEIWCFWRRKKLSKENDINVLVSHDNSTKSGSETDIKSSEV